MKNNLLLLLLFVTAFGCKKGTSPIVIPPVIVPDNTFSNPLLSSGPDPWVIKKDSVYYYMHTSGDRIQVWYTKSMSKLSSAPSKTIWTNL